MARLWTTTVRWGLVEQETKDSKPLAVKPVGVAKVGETPSFTGEYAGEVHRILEHIQTHPLGNQHLKGHNPLVGSEGSDGKWGWSRASERRCSL